MDNHSVTIRVGALTRLTNTENGNPRWRVVADDGRAWFFRRDAAVGNKPVPGEDEGRLVRLTLDIDGQVIGYEREDG